MESRHRWEGDRVPVGLLRLSVGLEDADELWADLEQALVAWRTEPSNSRDTRLPPVPCASADGSGGRNHEGRDAVLDSYDGQLRQSQPDLSMSRTRGRFESLLRLSKPRCRPRSWFQGTGSSRALVGLSRARARPLDGYCRTSRERWCCEDLPLDALERVVDRLRVAARAPRPCPRRTSPRGTSAARPPRAARGRCRGRRRGS